MRNGAYTVDAAPPQSTYRPRDARAWGTVLAAGLGFPGAAMLIDLQNYPLGRGFDELIDSDHQPRPAARALFDHIAKLDERELRMRRAALEATIATMGITFTIYSDGANIDRAWPFDIVPRIMAAAEWRRIEAGLRQRLTALNLFIDDLYNAQEIVRDGVFPAAYCPGLGWVDYDPTNGKQANLEFITLGWGREFSDVSPLRGVVLGPGTQNLTVAVDVQQI